MDTRHHLTAFITIQIGPQQFKRTGVQGAEGRVETGVMGKPTRAEIKPCFKCTSVPSIIYYSSRSFRRIVLRSRDPNPHGWSLLTCTRWRKGTKKKTHGPWDRETRGLIMYCCWLGQYTVNTAVWPCVVSKQHNTVIPVCMTRQSKQERRTKNEMWGVNMW